MASEEDRRDASNHQLLGVLIKRQEATFDRVGKLENQLEDAKKTDGQVLVTLARLDERLKGYEGLRGRVEVLEKMAAVGDETLKKRVSDVESAEKLLTTKITMYAGFLSAIIVFFAKWIWEWITSHISPP